MQNYSVTDRELNLYFEVEIGLVCLFDEAAKNVYKYFC